MVPSSLGGEPPAPHTSASWPAHGRFTLLDTVSDRYSLSWHSPHDANMQELQIHRRGLIGSGLQTGTETPPPLPATQWRQRRDCAAVSHRPRPAHAQLSRELRREQPGGGCGVTLVPSGTGGPDLAAASEWGGGSAERSGRSHGRAVIVLSGWRREARQALLPSAVGDCYGPSQNEGELKNPRIKDRFFFFFLWRNIPKVAV